MKYFAILLFAALLLLAFACKTKSNTSTDTKPIDPVAMEEMWKKIDSLESKGLVSSAGSRRRTPI